MSTKKTDQVKEKVKKLLLMDPKNINGIGMTVVDGESAVKINVTGVKEVDLPDEIDGVKLKIAFVGKIKKQKRWYKDYA